MVNVTFSMFDFNLWCVLGILKLVPFHYKNHHKINLHLASIFVLKACHFAEWIWQFYFLHSFKMIQSYFCVCFSSCWLIFLIRKYTHLAEVMCSNWILHPFQLLFSYNDEISRGMPNSIQKSCPTKKSTKSIGIKGDIIFRTESHTKWARTKKITFWLMV